MSSIVCRVHRLASPLTKAIILTQPLMERWGCQNGQSIKISLGNKVLITRVAGISRRNMAIYIPASIARQLAIPFFGETRASFRNRQLHLGPVIGILTTGYTGSPTLPFGMRSHLFRHFLLAGQADKPYFYVFTPEMVDWQQGNISGWFYRRSPSGTYHWTRHTVALPDVVYERVPNRKAEALPQVKECRNRLQTVTGSQIFNQGFFNKWSIHELLANHPLVGQYIPETALYPSVENIQSMTERHQIVYLKPSGGSLGLGIFRITRHPMGGYFCRFRNGEKNVLRRFHSLNKMIQHLFKKQPSRFHHYLVQQGIRLIRYKGRPVDFRVHMHKNRQGAWKVAGIGAKAAGFGSITTHIRTGGSLFSASALLQSIFGANHQSVKTRIESVSIQIAKALEEKTSGPLGELGMDIGVDKEGEIWLFEVNSKPGRHIFHHPDLREAGRRSARYITEYALMLANFV